MDTVHRVASLQQQSYLFLYILLVNFSYSYCCHRQISAQAVADAPGE